MNFSTPVGPLLPLSAARSSNSSRASRARAVGRGGVSLLFALAVGLAASDAAAQSVAADGAGRVTFAHPFRAGHCSGSVTVAGVPTETVVMRRHPDGSVRHAVLTADCPAAGSYALTCGCGDGAPAIATPAVQVEIGSLGTVAASGAGEAFGMERRWTAAGGPILVSIDARADGQVSVTGEHAWHDTPHDPEGRAVTTYDLTITVDGAVVYQRGGVRHHPQTRWRVVHDPQPGPHLAFDAAYLAATEVVPRYDTTKTPTAQAVERQWWLDPSRLHWAKTPHDPLTEEYGTTNPSFIGADEGSPLTPPQALYVTTGHPLPWQRSMINPSPPKKLFAPPHLVSTSIVLAPAR